MMDAPTSTTDSSQEEAKLEVAQQLWAKSHRKRSPTLLDLPIDILQLIIKACGILYFGTLQALTDAARLSAQHCVT